jgi:hypothetical protein
MTDGALGGAGASARGILTQSAWQLRLCTLRAHGGLPPIRYPGTARQRLATVTPADRARGGTSILPALYP